MTDATDQAAPPPADRSPRRRRSLGSFLFWLLVTLALLWLASWWGAREIAAAALDRVTAAANARGYTVECTDAVSGGFPLSLDLACSRAALAGETDPLTATLDGVAASAPLYFPGRLTWDSAGPLALDIPVSRLALSATWTASTSHIDAGFGGLAAVATRIEGLNLRLRPEARPIPLAGATAELADIAFVPASGDDYRLTAVAKALSPESEGGQHLPAIDLDADIAAVDFGGALGTDPGAVFRAWIAKGGAIRIDRLQLAAGAVSTSTAGTLVMAPGGALTGTLKVNIAGIEALPDLVESYKPGSRDEVAQVAAAIMAFTRPVETPAGPTRELQLGIRNNVVSLGIIPIGVIPSFGF